MALEENGLYSIEVGSIVWRHLLNTNFNNIYSKGAFDIESALYSDTVHAHTGYKDRTIAESDITTSFDTIFNYDVRFSDGLVGIIILDRTTATYKRLYVEDGVLLSEDA